MLIDVTKENTFPKEMKEIIYDYLAKLSDETTKLIIKNKPTSSLDIKCAIENYLSYLEAEVLYNTIISMLQNCVFICFHATKL